MEPIRPDNDELRAERPGGPASSTRPAGSAQRAPAGGEKLAQSAHAAQIAATGESRVNDKGKGGVGFLWLLVFLLACLAGAGWYLQEQRIQVLERQVEEADNWVRQSKLALARFEGTLSETGENLQQAGVSVGEQLASQQARLDTADSEIRKLWVVANERNKQQLEQQAAAIGNLETALDENRQNLAAVQAAIKIAETALNDALEQQQAERAELAARVAAAAAGTLSIKNELARVDQKTDALASSIDERIAAPIRRFEQEQKLTTSSIESRIAALKKEISGLASGNRLAAVRRDLASLKKTVEIIDSSRSQMTSRLVRLSQEVNNVQVRLAEQ